MIEEEELLLRVIIGGRRGREKRKMEMTVIGEKLGGRIHHFKGSWRKLKLSREVWDWLKGGAPLAFGVKEPPP